jgi:hypothetical protein
LKGCPSWRNKLDDEACKKKVDFRMKELRVDNGGDSSDLSGVSNRCRIVRIDERELVKVCQASWVIQLHESFVEKILIQSSS